MRKWAIIVKYKTKFVTQKKLDNRDEKIEYENGYIMNGMYIDKEMDNKIKVPKKLL